MKVRACYVAHDPDPDKFKESIASSKILCDEIVVVWGRFIGFDAPYVKPPKWLKSDKQIKVTVSDHKLEQYDQRTLMLKGMKTNDIVMYVDADEVIDCKEPTLKDYFKSVKVKWDAILMPIWNGDTGKIHQNRISVFRYKKGMKFGIGQSMYYKGKSVTGGNYNVIRPPAGLRYLTYMVKTATYKKAQKLMWEEDKKKVSKVIPPVTETKPKFRKDILLIIYKDRDRSPLVRMFYEEMKQSKLYDVKIVSPDNLDLEQYQRETLVGYSPVFVLNGLGVEDSVYCHNKKWFKQTKAEVIHSISDAECFKDISLSVTPDFLMLHSKLAPGFKERFDDLVKEKYPDAKIISVDWGIDYLQYPPAEVKDIDVAYLCTVNDSLKYHKNRVNFMKEMLYFDLTGNHKLMVGTDYKQFKDILSRSKILVVDGGGRGGLSQKYLEGACSGCVLVGEMPEMYAEDFKDGVICINQPNHRKLIDTLKGLLKNPNLMANYGCRVRKMVAHQFGVGRIRQQFESALRAKDGLQPRAVRDVRLAVVMPVHGREPLLVQTIRRLYRQTLPVYAIVCVGDSDSEKKAVEDAGGVFVKYKNDPLGEKWQVGVDEARRLGATDIMVMGSSGWISDQWCETMVREIWNGHDMIGKLDANLLDITKTGKRKLLFWPGYTSNHRKEEPIGGGRLLSKEILDKVNWQIFDKTLNSGLDWSTYQIVRDQGGNVFAVDSDAIYVLGLSFYHLWGNKHNWNLHVKKGKVYSAVETDKFLQKWFPDAMTPFEWGD